MVVQTSRLRNKVCRNRFSCFFSFNAVIFLSWKEGACPSVKNLQSDWIPDPAACMDRPSVCVIRKDRRVCQRLSHAHFVSLYVKPDGQTTNGHTYRANVVCTDTLACFFITCCSKPPEHYNDWHEGIKWHLETQSVWVLSTAMQKNLKKADC